MTHARLLLSSVPLRSSPSLRTLSQHSLFILDLPRPASLRSQPKATGQIAWVQAAGRGELCLLVGPRPFPVLQQLVCGAAPAESTLVPGWIRRGRRCWERWQRRLAAYLACFAIPFKQTTKGGERFL